MKGLNYLAGNRLNNSKGGVVHHINGIKNKIRNIFQNKSPNISHLIIFISICKKRKFTFLFLIAVFILISSCENYETSEKITNDNQIIPHQNVTISSDNHEESTIPPREQIHLFDIDLSNPPEGFEMKKAGPFTINIPNDNSLLFPGPDFNDLSLENDRIPQKQELVKRILQELSNAGIFFSIQNRGLLMKDFSIQFVFSNSTGTSSTLIRLSHERINTVLDLENQDDAYQTQKERLTETILHEIGHLGVVTKLNLLYYSPNNEGITDANSNMYTQDFLSFQHNYFEKAQSEFSETILANIDNQESFCGPCSYNFKAGLIYKINSEHPDFIDYIFMAYSSIDNYFMKILEPYEYNSMPRFHGKLFYEIVRSFLVGKTVSGMGFDELVIKYPFIQPQYIYEGFALQQENFPTLNNELERWREYTIKINTIKKNLTNAGNVQYEKSVALTLSETNINSSILNINVSETEKSEIINHLYIQPTPTSFVSKITLIDGTNHFHSLNYNKSFSSSSNSTTSYSHTLGNIPMGEIQSIKVFWINSMYGRITQAEYESLVPMFTEKERSYFFANLGTKGYFLFRHDYKTSEGKAKIGDQIETIFNIKFGFTQNEDRIKHLADLIHTAMTDTTRIMMEGTQKTYQ